MAIGTITIDGGAQPILDGAVNKPIVLDVTGGWALVANAQWYLLQFQTSAAVLTLPGLIAAPGPFANGFTADISGGYEIILHVEYNDGSEDWDRAVFQIEEPFMRDPYQRSTALAAAPAVYETGRDPQFEGATPPATRDTTYGWGHVSQQIARIQAASFGQARFVGVYNGSGANRVTGEVVCPRAGNEFMVFIGGAGGAAPALADRRHAIDVELADGTDYTQSNLPYFYLLGDLDAGEYGLAVVDGWVPAITVLAASSPGEPVWVNGVGILVYRQDCSPAIAGGVDDVIARQVGVVLNDAAAAAAPPGGIWFKGVPNSFTRATGLSGPYSELLAATGLTPPSFDINSMAATHDWRITHRGGGAAGNFTWRAGYMANIPASQWNEETDRSFEFWIYTDRAGVIATVTIYRTDGTVAYTGIPATWNPTITPGSWQYAYIPFASLDFTNGVEPFAPGKQFVIEIGVQWSGAAVLGDLCNIRNPGLRDWF